MDEAFLQYLRQFEFLTHSDINLIWDNTQLKRFETGEQIVNIGDVVNQGITVLEGVLRNYYFTSKGDEHTVYLVAKGMAIGSDDCIFQGKPSTIVVEAVEPSLVMLVNSEKIDKLGRTNPGLLKWQNRRIRMNMAEAAEQVKFYTVLSPEERFIALRDQHPT